MVVVVEIHEVSKKRDTAIISISVDDEIIQDKKNMKVPLDTDGLLDVGTFQDQIDLRVFQKYDSI